ncbi:MAG: glycosyltransferase [Xanthomonadales bacterium]|nr:glycosyltransferase [Xanthomonadales bacterium]
MSFAELLFIACFVFTGYTYVGYPLIVALLARWFPAPPVKTQLPDAKPKVAVIIPVFNGLPYLQGKLDSLRAQDYPTELLQIVMIDDGSDDGSADFLSSQSDVTLLRVDPRQGKPNALNTAIECLDDSIEVLVLTDVRQKLSVNAVSVLVAALGDPGVGAASGELQLTGKDGSAAEIGLYWRYEKWIRVNESRFSSTPGASGALYAIRRRDFRPLRKDTLLDDFEIPTRAAAGSRRIILVPQARAYDEAEVSLGGERNRKIRTLAGWHQSLVRNHRLLLPGNPVFFQFMSHRVFRLLVPYALAGMLLACVAAESPWMVAAGVAQLVFYAVALAGVIFGERRNSSRIVRLAATFLTLNLAVLAGFARFVRGSYTVKW